jgi:hypothetical protein
MGEIHDRGPGRGWTSVWGDWQHGWSSCGGGFKAFLCGLGMDYVARKFNADREFDRERTVNHYKRDLIKERRERGPLSKDDARTVWGEIENVDATSTEVEFGMELARCDALMNRYDHMPPLYHRVSMHFQMFWKECWPRLIEQLRAEMRGPVISISESF